MNATLQSRGVAAARDANRATTTAEGSTSPRTRLLGAGYARRDERGPSAPARISRSAGSAPGSARSPDRL